MSRCDSPLSADRPLLGARADALGVSFRVWAPAAHRVDVAVQALNGTVRHHPLAAEPDGHFSGHVSGLAPGTRYRYRLDASAAWPDPCARYLPEGPHGAAMVVDEQAFQWTDAAWRGVRLDGQLIYELHVGTFTPTGTLDAAIEKLPHLRALGVTVIELMPLAECPGRWNWGYDGVGLYAPYHVYGDPDALRRFVDAAHQMGLAVILDTLAPGHPAYKPTYEGDLRSRDAAYHQGTVWPWLIGHFIEAWLKLHPDRVAARRFLANLPSHLRLACVGSISEIFDAEPPELPRGCIAQAWSVAEALRAWLMTDPDRPE